MKTITLQIVMTVEEVEPKPKLKAFVEGCEAECVSAIQYEYMGAHPRHGIKILQVYAGNQQIIDLSKKK